jgi:hypothetical protein
MRKHGFESRWGRNLLVEQRTFNPLVVGSNPTGRTTFFLNKTNKLQPNFDRGLECKKGVW